MLGYLITRHDDQWWISMRDDPHKSETHCSHTHLSGLPWQDILYSHSDLRLGFKNTTNWQPACLTFIIHLIHIICYTSTKQNTTHNQGKEGVNFVCLGNQIKDFRWWKACSIQARRFDFARFLFVKRITSIKRKKAKWNFDKQKQPKWYIQWQERSQGQ